MRVQFLIGEFLIGLGGGCIVVLVRDIAKDFMLVELVPHRSLVPAFGAVRAHGSAHLL